MLHRPVNQPLAKTLPAELAQLPETVMIHDRHRLLPERQVWPQIPSRPHADHQFCRRNEHPGHPLGNLTSRGGSELLDLGLSGVRDMDLGGE
jgi:hypothetical protein